MQGQARKRRSNARSACEGAIGVIKISLVGSDTCRTKGRGGTKGRRGPLQGSVVWLLSQLFAASPVKTSMQINS